MNNMKKLQVVVVYRYDGIWAIAETVTEKSLVRSPVREYSYDEIMKLMIDQGKSYE